MVEKGILFCVILFTYGIAVSQVKVQALLTENLSNPICLDRPQPRFSWQLVSPQRNVLQTAYEIIVSVGNSIRWKSGKIKTDQSLNIQYKGDPLQSGEKYNWSVRVWDQDDHSSAWSKPAGFQMALLGQTAWQAKWIGYEGVFSPAEKPDDRFTRVAARYLRKEFSVSRKIKKAVAYISGVGLYELYLNGKKIGNDVLAPGPTDYAKRVFYNTFDVTRYLVNGTNAAGVILGNGRFVAIRQHLDDTTNNCVNYGFPRLLLQMEITLDDNTRQTVLSDDSWMISGDGPIIANNEFDGEEYNAEKEFKAWSVPGFVTGKRWKNAHLVAPAAPVIQSQINPPIKVIETLKPLEVTSPKPGMFVFNMGQNMVGWAQLKVKGARGTQVKMRFAERLNNDGTIYTDNLGDARVTDCYTLRGEGVEVWEPRFTYHGFQFVEVTGYPGTPDLTSIIGKVVHDNLTVIGKIETSNEVLNKLYHNMYWGIRGNYRGIPTDCPQRDERMGWLGDRAAVGTGESFMFNTHLLYAKWMQDIEDAQNEAGSIPDVAPAYWRMYTDNTTWPAAYVYNIRMLYQQFGDDEPVKKYYASIKKWLAYLKDRYMKDYIITENTYGDWCVPPETLTMIFSEDPARKTPGDYLSTAFYYDMLKIMTSFALISGNDADVDYFKELAKNVRDGFNRKFFNGIKNYYANNTATANILALAFDMVPENRRPAVFEQVVDKTMIEAKGHITTGLIGIQQLMRTLTDNGRPDIAYLLATTTTYPGWGYMLTQGATTIWELWNGNTANPAMNSANHVMMIGDLLTWYYECLAGIKAASPGFKDIVMKPIVAKGLTFVNASYQSPYGTIQSSWSVKKEGFEWKIEIPVNCKAVVYLPANAPGNIKESGRRLATVQEIKPGEIKEGYFKLELGSGKYDFVVN